MGKTAALAMVQKKIIDTLHKEGKPQRVITELYIKIYSNKKLIFNCNNISQYFYAIFFLSNKCDFYKKKNLADPKLLNINLYTT